MSAAYVSRLSMVQPDTYTPPETSPRWYPILRLWLRAPPPAPGWGRRAKRCGVSDFRSTPWRIDTARFSAGSPALPLRGWRDLPEVPSPMANLGHIVDAASPLVDGGPVDQALQSRLGAPMDRRSSIPTMRASTAPGRLPLAPRSYDFGNGP